MKRLFKIYDLRFTIGKKSSGSSIAARRHGIGSQLSTFNSQPSQRGIALVITLILLSVTLIMAVAFLAISNRERNAVTTTTDAATAKLAADSALAHAEAQIAANVLATTNPFSFGLLVSTNYLNGFITGISSPTNVNYSYTNGNPLSGGDNLLNLANLLYSPRPPVFVPNPTNSSLPSEFRFYLDLNRNALFDPNGVMPETNEFAVATGVLVTNIGDPEWIGQLTRPDLPHGPNNFFVARYAFFGAPVGNTLDLNYIHNQVFDEPSSASSGVISVNPGANTSEGFFRNQGVGTWEINLAAFLADLNTNVWGQNIAGVPDSFYDYRQPAFANIGVAFDDARALLAYRYDNDYNSLASASVLFGNAGLMFENDSIDGYSDGTLMTNAFLPPDLVNNDDPTKRWAGADNTNHFFNLPADVFDISKTARGAGTPNFTDRLRNTGTNSTYDRYTFYRLLSQLGTDSEPERGKINLNYANVDAAGTIVPNWETNLTAWTPAQFFTNAADRLLRVYTTNWFKAAPTKFLATYYGITNYNGDTNYYHINPDGSVLTNDFTGLGLTNLPFFGMTNQIPAFGIGNIPVMVSNKFVYSSAVNRLLQLAANIYDAAYYTNHLFAGAYLPTLFQPVFTNINNNVYIAAYIEFTNSGATLASTQPLDLNEPGAVASLLPFNLVYGVPIIVGAKKGFPNFNEFDLEGVFTITRKVQITRTSTNLTFAKPTDPDAYKLNQLFSCSTYTQIGVECWNSYFTNYTRATTISIANKIQMVLTNDEGTYYSLPPNYFLNSAILTNNWAGIGTTLDENSFISTNLTAPFIPISTYKFSTATLQPITNGYTETYETGVNKTMDSFPHYPQPHWGLITTNNIQVVMIDAVSGRAIDYVQLNGPSSSRDLINEITTAGKDDYSKFWLTNGARFAAMNINVPSGLYNQLNVSLASRVSNQHLWQGQDPNTVDKQINGFNKFLWLTPRDGDPYGSTNLQIQAPYTPTAVTFQYVTWQANDPLVHYLKSDLNVATDPAHEAITNGINQWDMTNVPTPPNLAQVNFKYEPWGRIEATQNDPLADNNSYNFAYKDPSMFNSDGWNFPVGKFPTVGWLGRVHRGTPWQTVFLKGTNILDLLMTNAASQIISGMANWKDLTGNPDAFDASNAVPVQDRLMFDVFTTALNDNATRGQLSVNQSGLAAWSALFSGIAVPTTLTNTYVIIDPAGPNGLNSPLGQLVTNINYARATFTNVDGVGGSFEHVGDILRAPKLTEQSPFILNTLDLHTEVSDELMEWLPQQTMSLLRCPASPRYVVYCYGQTLKPAPNSLVTSLSAGREFFGMCTNYQIVSEAVIRAIIRVDDADTSHPHAVVESYNFLPPD